MSGLRTSLVALVAALGLAATPALADGMPEPKKPVAAKRVKVVKHVARVQHGLLCPVRTICSQAYPTPPMTCNVHGCFYVKRPALYACRPYVDCDPHLP